MSLGNCKLKQRHTTAHIFKCPESKTLTVLNAGEDVSPKSSHSLLMGTQNDTAAVEDSLVVAYKTERTLTKPANIFTPRWLLTYIPASNYMLRGLLT